MVSTYLKDGTFIPFVVCTYDQVPQQTGKPMTADRWTWFNVNMTTLMQRQPLVRKLENYIYDQNIRIPGGGTNYLKSNQIKQSNKATLVAKAVQSGRKKAKNIDTSV